MQWGSGIVILYKVVKESLVHKMVTFKQGLEGSKVMRHSKYKWHTIHTAQGHTYTKKGPTWVVCVVHHLQYCTHKRFDLKINTKMSFCNGP